MIDHPQQSTRHRPDPLPLSLAPRGLSRPQAAAYLGISPSLFDDMVKAGEAPKSKKFRGRVVWDRLKLDLMFEETEHASGRNTFD